MQRKKEVLEALAKWTIHTAEKSEKGSATPEEVEALPKVAEVFLNNYSSLLSVSPVKKS